MQIQKQTPKRCVLFKEIEIRAQNLLTILSSIANMIGRTSVAFLWFIVAGA